MFKNKERQKIKTLPAQFKFQAYALLAFFIYLILRTREIL